MPQASAPARDDTGGSIPTTMRCSGGAGGNARRLDHGARPQRVGPVLDDLAVDLLPAEPRAGVARQHLVEERRRQMRGVRVRRGARHRGARIGDQALHQRDRPRRRGDELARLPPEPQPELQHVEGRVRLPPLGELVAPGGVELRPAQQLRVFGRERLRHRAVRPFQQPARRRSTPAAPRAAICAAGPTRPRSSPRARRARSRRRARCGDAGGPRKASLPCASARTHSAPSRVLPAPRPPSTSQVVHGPPLFALAGGSWCRCASVAKSFSQPHPPPQVGDRRQHVEAQSGLRRTRQCGAQGRDGTRRCLGECHRRHRSDSGERPQRRRCRA